MLMGLFMTALEQHVRKLDEHNIRLRIVGEREALSSVLQARIAEAENLTSANTGLTLVIAANYGGRWDIARAAQRLAAHRRVRHVEPSPGA